MCLQAAAMAISNLLGLVCDPVAGLVEVPCQSRNAAGAVNAVTCAEITLSGVVYPIPFDEMVDAMYKVGKSIPFELRETAIGGCAGTPTGMWNALQNLTEKRQKNKKCIKSLQRKHEFCKNRQLCEKNKSGKTNISSDKEKH